MARDRQKGGDDQSPPHPSSADQDGLDAVAAAIRDAEEEREELKLLGQFDPPIGGELNGIRPGEWLDRADEYGLPPGCPVLPLGTEDGVFYFINTIGEMRAVKDSELGQATIRGLFMGRHLWLHWAFPRTNRDGVVTSWRPERAAEVLTAACARRGSWSPLNNVRGRGLWKDRDGKLIVHCGNQLFTQRGPEPLGEYQGKVYPSRPAIAAPWPQSLVGKKGPASRLLPHFQSWEWGRPELDPVLLLGWQGVGYAGGALPYRPASYELGDKATGKSSLHNDLKSLFDEWLINTGDTTSAGLYQLLKFDSLPVAIDEFEAKADNRKAKAVIELMRLSYSGAPMNRGGDNHKGTQFYGRSAFNFSSINMPPMEPQDLSRTVILRLKKVPAGKSKPVIPEEELRDLGRKILRRIFDNWHRWNATWTAWRDFLADCGHDGRGQDTFGTLLAMADLIVADDAAELGLAMGPNCENFNDWREVLDVKNLTELADATENWQSCLTHLLSKRIEAWRGGTRHTVGEVLAEFFDHKSQNAIGYDEARKLLEQTGLTLKKPDNNEPVAMHFRLMIPHNNPLLYEVFFGSKWQGELGTGSWTNALRQAPSDIWRDESARINGVKTKGTAFALKDIIVTEQEASS